jgi:hypothetical protein
VCIVVKKIRESQQLTPELFALKQLVLKYKGFKLPSGICWIFLEIGFSTEKPFFLS